ncbi:hypothetical protein HK101_011276, partial [Irineochytrium annulatum]
MPMADGFDALLQAVNIMEQKDSRQEDAAERARETGPDADELDATNGNARPTDTSDPRVSNGTAPAPILPTPTPAPSTSIPSQTPPTTSHLPTPSTAVDTAPPAFSLPTSQPKKRVRKRKQPEPTDGVAAGVALKPASKKMRQVAPDEPQTVTALMLQVQPIAPAPAPSVTTNGAGGGMGGVKGVPAKEQQPPRRKLRACDSCFTRKL